MDQLLKLLQMMKMRLVQQVMEMEERMDVKLWTDPSVVWSP